VRVLRRVLVDTRVARPCAVKAVGRCRPSCRLVVSYLNFKLAFHKRLCAVNTPASPSICSVRRRDGFQLSVNDCN
jgi:hypothetical protein